MKRPKTTLMPKLALSALAAITVLGAAEVVLRFVGPVYYRFNGNSAEYYTNPRGYHVPIRTEGKNIIYGLNYNQSPEGFRTADFEYDKSGKKAAEHTILALGDSFTFGRGVKYEDIYTTRLSKMLKENGYDYSVRNCGLIGADIERISEIYRLESEKNAYPLVIYGFVLNDFGLSSRAGIKGSDFIDNNNGGSRWSAVRDASRVYNLFAYAVEKRRLNDRTARAYLEAFRDGRAERKFELITAMNKSIESKGGKLVVIVFPLLYDLKDYPFKEIHEKLAGLCASKNIAMLDLLPVFSVYKAEDLWANPTDQHPNETAHKLAAESLYSYLAEHGFVKHG
jgi:lysophospholipase L1-like esterase